MALALKGLPSWSSIAGRRTAADIVQGTRAIHVQAPPPPSSTATVSHINVSGRVIKTAKTAFSRFVAHLTTPGLSHPTAHSSRSIFTSAHIANRSKVNPAQGLSFPARYALANGLGNKTLYIPRIPASVPRQSTFQVGLGTARNFSTGRGAFQHFVDNVPIAMRTAYEADIDPKKAALKKERMKRMKGKQRQNNKENALFEVLGDSVRSGKKTSKHTQVSMEKKLDAYFPISDATSDSDVSTFMLIPLAPTPTSRLPLSTLSTDTSSKHGPRLLPRSILMKVHNDYRTHSAKISSLFMRLDRAHVWSRGVQSDVYGDPSGLCTILRLEFTGWTKEMVLGVLGDAGKGWCEIVEVKHSEENVVSESEIESMSSALGDDASIFSSEEDYRVSAPDHPETFDPAASFVMPTLSFSSSIADSIYGDFSRPSWSREDTHPPTLPSQLPPDLPSHRNIGDFESNSDAGSDDSWASWNTLDSTDLITHVSIPAPASATASWLGVSFSSDFMRRRDVESELQAGDRFANVFY